MEPVFQAVIFDLDGVLVSTDEQHYQGWKALADRLGVPFDRAVNNRFRGVSRMACLVVEDAVSGVEAAHAGGMPAAAGDAAHARFAAVNPSAQ